MLIRSMGTRDFRKFFFDDLKILVDGVVTHDIIEADDEAGYAIRYLRGADGKLIEDVNVYKTERLEGKVEFTGTRRWSPDEAKAAAAAKRDRRALRNMHVQAGINRRNSDAG